MSKKKTRTTPAGPAKPKATRQSAATAHEQEFAESIMAPKFWHLLSENDFELTYTTMALAYNSTFGTRLSVSTIRKYLDLLGWKYERKPMWTGLPQMTGPVPPQAPQVDTAAILHGEDDREPDQIGDGLPGQGSLTQSEVELLG